MNKQQLNDALNAWGRGDTDDLPTGDMRAVARKVHASWVRSGVFDEDLLHDSFVDLLEMRRDGRLDPSKNVFSYWIQITYRNCYNVYRKWGNQLQIIPSSEAVRVADPEHDHSASYREAVDGWDLRMHVARVAAEVLEGAQLRRFLAIDVEGRHYTELADEEGVSRQAIHLTLTKARKRVAERLEEDQSQPTA